MVATHIDKAAPDYGARYVVHQAGFTREWLRRGVPGRVSVVIACYNLEKYLGAAIESALFQGGDIELLLADDGSTDGTRAIIAEYAARHPNIIALYSQTNVGPFSVRNWAMRECTGEFIAFLDGDDYWKPGKTEAQLEALTARPEAGLVHLYLGTPINPGVIRQKMIHCA